MYSLLIDAGNTRIKLGLINNNKNNNNIIINDNINILYRFNTQDLNTIETLSALLKALDTVMINQNNQSSVNPIVVCVGVCVAGETIQTHLTHIISTHINIDIQWLTGQTVLNGFNNTYISKHSLGADRLLSVYGLYHYIKNNNNNNNNIKNKNNHNHNHYYILATFGTATTLDVLSIQEGIPSFEGGLILAGLETSLRALSLQTASLSPLMSQLLNDIHTHTSHNNNDNTVIMPVIPKNSYDALLYGAMTAQIGAITTFKNALLKQYNTLHNITIDIPVFVSGGYSTVLLNHIDISIHHYIPINTTVLLGLAYYIDNQYKL